MVSDGALAVFLAAVGVVGFVMLWRGTGKLRVALQSWLWPKVPLSFVHVGLRHVTHTSVQSEPIDGVETAYYDSVDNGLFFSKGTRKEYFPVLTYGFEVDGETHRGVNVDPWNAGGYSGDRSLVQETHEAWAASKPAVKVHPRNPALHFLGWRQFPIVSTFLQLTAGMFLAEGLPVAISMLLEMNGVAEPTFGEARRSVLILAPPLVAALLLVVRLPLPREPTRTGG